MAGGAFECAGSGRLDRPAIGRPGEWSNASPGGGGMTQRVSGTKSLIVINPNSSQSVTDGIASALSLFEGRG